MVTRKMPVTGNYVGKKSGLVAVFATCFSAIVIAVHRKGQAFFEKTFHRIGGNICHFVHALFFLTPQRRQHKHGTVPDISAGRIYSQTKPRKLRRAEMMDERTKAVVAAVTSASPQS
jgi:hypothetical protein